MHVLLPGDVPSLISTQDRGLIYGDGLFETMRVAPGRKVPLLEWHLRRLAEGAQRLNIPFDKAIVSAGVEKSLKSGNPAAGHVLKLILTRGVGGRGYLAPDPALPTLVVERFALPHWNPSSFEEGVCACSPQMRLSCNPLLGGLKHLNRLEQVLARAEVEREGCQEGVMLDGYGRVVEGVFSNLFVYRDGVVMTPAIVEAGVAGVMRAWLIEHLQSQGVHVHIGEVGESDLYDASEWFFCNSLYGIWPVRQWHDRQWADFPLSRRLQHAISCLFGASLQDRG